MMKQKEDKITLYIMFGVLIIFGVIAGFLVLNKDNAGRDISPNATDIVIEDGKIIAYKYNNFPFEKKNNIWYTQVQPEIISRPYTVAFTYGPINIEDIEIEYKSNYFAQYTKPLSKVYLTFDHDIQNGSYLVVASVNLVSNMKAGWLINSSRACLKNSSLCVGVPIVTCKSHPNNAVIQLIESNKTKVLYDDNCLTIEASGRDFIRAAERVILDWYGVM